MTVNAMRRGAKTLGLVLALLVAGCSSDSPAAVSGYDDLDEPTVIASDADEDLDQRWQELADTAVAAEPRPTGSEPVPEFEPFNQGLELSDGRVLLRGKWDSDEILASWHQRNPAVVADGEENPVVDTSDQPIRLFVYDPGSGDLQPVSHVPAVHEYSTAVSVGTSPDAVLEVAVLPGERTVAYTSGFNGAGYDVPREIWVAPIPSS